MSNLFHKSDPLFEHKVFHYNLLMSKIGSVAMMATIIFWTYLCFSLDGYRLGTSPARSHTVINSIMFILSACAAGFFFNLSEKIAVHKHLVSFLQYFLIFSAILCGAYFGTADTRLNESFLIFWIVLIFIGTGPYLHPRQALVIYGISVGIFLCGLLSIESNMEKKIGELSITVFFSATCFCISQVRYVNFETEYKNQTIIEQKNRELLELNEKLLLASETDPLTNIYNRRNLESYSEKIWKSCKAARLPISIIMIDIDYFKNFNDFFGHINGDKCLIQISKKIDSFCRPEYRVFRFGGEEFIIVMPNLENGKAMETGEKIRAEIKNLQIRNRFNNKDIMLTVSLGVSTVTPNQKNGFWNLVEDADKALYHAKELGRDHCVNFRDIQTS